MQHAGGVNGGDDRRTWRRVLSQSWTSTDLVFLISRKVLLAYAVLVGCGAMLFLAWENTHTRSLITARHAEIHRSFENVMSEALWTFNDTVLRSVVLGITQDDTITGARIDVAEAAPAYTAGALSDAKQGWSGPLGDHYVSRWPLSWVGPRGPEVVGYLHLESSDEVIKNRLLQRIFMILLFSVIALLSLFLVFFLVIRSEVLNPISKLSQMMHNYRLGRADGDQSAISHPGGEIGKLYDSFRDLEGRLQAAHGKLTTAADEMALQLARQADELSRSHALNMTYEVTRAQETERRRLMRDMHDGFGSELVSARIAAERGNLDSAEIAQFLSKCIADLHLIINVTGTEAGNLAEAIADWRYRVSRQLAGEPFKLVWDINLTGAPKLSQRAVLQILRIAQEAVSNAARHSDAREIRISVRHDAGDITLRVSDDGSGFKSGALEGDDHRGKGLASMAARAREIGAELAIEGGPAGCRVTLAYRLNEDTERGREPQPALI